MISKSVSDVKMRNDSCGFRKNNINEKSIIMKKWIVATLLLFFTAGAFAQSKTSETPKGTVFRSGTMKELLAASAKEKKYVFIDVYATWCGPCKYMAVKIFPQEKMGTYFNKNFVVAKFDAERGEGVSIAEKYNVRAYPTFLILDSTGKEVGRIVGGADPDDFIAKVQEVVDNAQKDK